MGKDLDVVAVVCKFGESRKPEPGGLLMVPIVVDGEIDIRRCSRSPFGDGAVEDDEADLIESLDGLKPLKCVPDVPLRCSHPENSLVHRWHLSPNNVCMGEQAECSIFILDAGSNGFIEPIKSTIWLINSSLFSGSMRASGAPCQFIWFLPEIYQVC